MMEMPEGISLGTAGIGGDLARRLPWEAGRKQEVGPRQTALPPGRGANMVFVLPRFAITAALLASAVHAQTEPSNGAEGCRCIGLTAVSWRASYTNESSGSPVLTATVESSDYMYPVDYGFGSCEQWDLSLEPSCADADGTRLPAAPSWCERRWCWVDPASCDQRDVAETAYFPGADAHCGSHRRRHHCRRCCRRCCRMPLRASLPASNHQHLRHLVLTITASVSDRLIQHMRRLEYI